MTAPRMTAPVQPASLDARQQVLADSNAGMARLVPEAYRCWANEQMRRAAAVKLTEAHVAWASGLAHQGRELGPLLDGNEPITELELVSLRAGFARLARDPARPFEYEPPRLDDVSLGVAGWVHALNCAGVRQGAPLKFRPVGVVHFYCLRMMFGKGDWYRAIAGGYSPPALDQLAIQTRARAVALAGEVPVVLPEHVAGCCYTVAPTYAAFDQLRRAWGNPWRTVFDTLGGAP